MPLGDALSAAEAEKIIDKIINPAGSNRGVLKWGAFPVDKGQSLVVFQSPYTPFIYDPKIPYIDAYYTVSNKGYHALKEICARLTSAGINATPADDSIDLRAAAEKCGLSLRGFKHHLNMTAGEGSYFFIQAIIINTPLTIIRDYTKNDIACKNCDACVRACPTGALGGKKFDRAKCIRHHMSSGEITDLQIAEAAGSCVLGCFRCQASCPLNKAVPAEYPNSLRSAIERFSETWDLSGLKALIGANMARKDKLTNLLINAYGNMCAAGKMDFLLRMSKDEKYRFSALRAIQKIEQAKSQQKDGTQKTTEND